MSKSITIKAEYSKLTPKVRQHLSIIGKRAKTVNGESMFSDLSVSSNEESVLTDIFASGAETLVANLVDLSVSYKSGVTVGGVEKEGLTFVFKNIRWEFTDKDNTLHDVTKALEEAIYNYLYNFCLGQYLAEIHPTTGAKYPPLYGQTYIDHCSVILNNIRTIAYNKRPTSLSSTTKSMADISGGIVQPSSSSSSSSDDSQQAEEGNDGVNDNIEEL